MTALKLARILSSTAVVFALVGAASPERGHERARVELARVNRCSYFRANPMCVPLPIRKSVAANSVRWADVLFAEGHNGLGSIEITNDRDDADDASEPLFVRRSTTTSVGVNVVCDRFPWSANACAKSGMNGSIVRVPADVRAAPNSDHHVSIADTIRGGEVDFWEFPVGHPSSLAHVGGAGFCPYAGDGTGCSGSTATNIATSLGGIDPAIVSKMEKHSHGILPYAISVSALCADPTWVFPATSSDGKNTDTSPACSGHTGPGERPPEGTRGFIDRSDLEIDATRNAPYVKVILRTMDREHLGFTITDTNWSGAPGLAPQYRTSSPIAWRFALREAGLGASGRVRLPITVDGLDLRSDVRFCSNGTC